MTKKADGEEKQDLILPTDEKALQDALKPAPGTEEISSEDIVLPRIRLLQDQSAEVKSKEATSGKLKHSLTGEEYASLEFIPLTMHKSRIMFDMDNRDGAPLCRSNNFQIGSDGTRCIECGNSKWQNNKPPVCNTIFNYLIIQPKEVSAIFIPSILSLMKTSSQAALKLNTAVECTFPRQPFWNKVWRVTPRVKRFTKGDAYILDVQQVRDTTKEEREWASLLYKSTMAKKVEIVSEDLPVTDVPAEDLS
jgi:hypothetical protein